MDELSLDDPRWSSLAGLYGAHDDPRSALRALAAGADSGAAWTELWEQLHHQGDVSELSYAAIVALAGIFRDRPPGDWNLYALAATVEVERHRRTNPVVPGWLWPAYARAWRELLALALAELGRATDPLVVRTALPVVALAHGATLYGALITDLTEDEAEEILEGRMSWSELYDDRPPLRR